MKFFPAIVAALLFSSAVVFAAPGAHGPNGEHLDAPTAAASSSSAVPNFEAQSEQFELVGQLQGGELSLLINHFATNEPVFNASVEVESGSLKAAAKFHTDMGDYAVDDAALLKALAAPGEHPLVVTILAGADSDLLDGTLKVSAGTAVDGHADDGHGHDGPSATVWLALGLVVLAVLAWFLGRKPKTIAMASKGGAL